MVAAGDGKNDNAIIVSLNLPVHKNEGFISSDGLGNIKFGGIGNDLRYNIYKSLSQGQVKSDINLSDLQVMVDHISKKNTLSPIATGSANMYKIGVVKLLDGAQLASYLDNGCGSYEVEICPGYSLNLNGVLIGDLDGFYASNV